MNINAINNINFGNPDGKMVLVKIKTTRPSNSSPKTNPKKDTFTPSRKSSDKNGLGKAFDKACDKAKEILGD